MKRGGRLRRSKPLARATAPLRRSKPLARIPARVKPQTAIVGRSAVRLKTAWKDRDRQRCPCGARSEQAHHVVYRQEIERLVGKSAGHVIYDLRNRLVVCADCHERHHNRSRPLTLAVLPDSAFEFAVELLGAGKAFEYLRRRYSGQDQRLADLIA